MHRAEGRWVTDVADIEDPESPESIRDAVARRLNIRPSECGRILGTAAVLGRSST